MSAQPPKHPTGEKAARPIVINDGSDNGSTPPSQNVPTQEQAQAAQPQAAPQTPEPPDLHMMVELATVEAMLARQQRGQALRELMVVVIAGAALVFAGAAYYRTAQLMSEGDEVPE